MYILKFSRGKGMNLIEIDLYAFLHNIYCTKNVVSILCFLIPSAEG